MHQEWIENYDPTIEDSYRTQLSVDVSYMSGFLLITMGIASNQPCVSGTSSGSRNVRVTYTTHAYSRFFPQPGSSGLTWRSSLDTAGADQFGEFPLRLTSRLTLDLTSNDSCDAGPLHEDRPGVYSRV